MIGIDRNKCDICGVCASACPFSAIEFNVNGIDINSSCKLCKLCIKACPQNALYFQEPQIEISDKNSYTGILVYVEHIAGVIHPVTWELISEAKRLASTAGYSVNCLFIGSGIGEEAKSLKAYRPDKIYVYDHPQLKYFKADTYKNVFLDCIMHTKPSVVLVGATSGGRSLAPQVATALKTGLTADCTKLELRKTGDLAQIRPAFGGNIMAQIVTPRTRPQFATVRYKVMKSDSPARPGHEGYGGEIVNIPVENTLIESRITILGEKIKENITSISEAEKIVAVGRALKDKGDMEMVFALANVLDAQVAVTRPLVEAGFMPYTHQIGLSGRTVRPKLIITLGISGAVQFTACMKSSDCIIAVNTDKNAQIFDIAHYGIIGDIYEITPLLTTMAEAGKGGLYGL